jgi:hypothetical protein
MTDQAFSPRLLAGWIAAMAVITAFALLLVAQSGDRRTVTDAVGPTTLSRSAIGYAGIADVLRRLGIRVIKSQSDTAAKLSPGGVLVIAEPLSLTPSLSERTARAGATLLVLPKWSGIASTTEPGFVAHVDPVPERRARDVVRLTDPQAEVIRRDSAEAFSAGTLGVSTLLKAPVQLVRSTRLRPIVGSNDGMLVGEWGIKGHRVWVLSDPDVMANHAMADTANVAFSVALIEALRGDDGNVVFDETVHSIAMPSSSNPLRLLFRLPFLVATILGAVALLLALWAAIGRFGAPQSLEPPLRFGKQDLIENTARLIEFAGHQRPVVRRYVETSLRDLGQRLHAPTGLAGDALAAWLDRIGAARGAASSASALQRRAGDLPATATIQSLVALARDVHRFKQEIINGAAGHPRRHGRAAERDPQGDRRPG